MKEKKSFLFKLGLVGLAVASLFIACFSNATIITPDFTLSKNYVGLDSFVALNNSYYGLKLTFNGGNAIYCVKEQYYELSNGFLPSIMLCDGSESVDLTNSLTTNYNNNTTHCKKLGELTYVGNNPNSITVDYSCYNNYPVAYAFANNQVSYNRYIGVQQFFYNSNFTSSNCSVMSSLECQTTYSLIPVSSVDQSYCESNNLCPSGGSSDCPNIGVSNLFINDIFHPGAFNVVINIPEEIDRDYAYTNSGQNFNLDIVGYNVDYTKVQDQIDIQNYKPTTDELSQIVSEIVPLFVPGLAIILLLYFIFRFIKKIF